MKKVFVKCIAVCCCVLMFVGLLGCQNQEPYEPTEEELVTWETEGIGFASYDYPVMPLTTVEPVEGLVAERDIKIHLMEPIGDWGEAVQIQDHYLLTNTNEEPLSVTLAYPYMYGWFYEEADMFPTLSVAGEIVTDSTFSDVVIEHDGFGFKSYGVLKEQYDVEAIYGEGKEWSALNDIPVTIYKVLYDELEDAEMYEDTHPGVKVYYENTNNYNLILGNSQSWGRDEEGDFIEATYGYHTNKTLDIICVSGELEGFSGAIEVYEKGKATRWEHDITVSEETATLGQVIDTYNDIFDGYVSTYDGTYTKEDYLNAINYVLQGYVEPMAEGYSNGRIASFSDIVGEALNTDRICYLYQDVTIPAKDSITVEMTQNKARSSSYGYDTRFDSEPESWFGFEIATNLGSNLEFTSLKADVTWDEGVVILADNIVPEEDGTLNLEKELYYIYYLTQDAMKYRFRPAGAAAAKPVLYLYPEETTDVTVKLNVDGALTSTWPKYDAKTGWQVTAQPDGTIIDMEGYEYSYLFWEASLDQEWDFSKGFVVAGEDSAEFLREKLAYMGLTPTEYNEFIVYWAPILEENAYNLIAFQWEEYEQAAALAITPTPDSMLRVYMAYQPLSAPMDVPEQELPVLERKGFTVVEWGGNRLGN